MRQLTRVIFLRLLSVWVTHATSASSLATSPRAPAVEATPASAREFCSAANRLIGEGCAAIRHYANQPARPL